MKASCFVAKNYHWILMNYSTIYLLLFFCFAIFVYGCYYKFVRGAALISEALFLYFRGEFRRNDGENFVT